MRGRVWALLEGAKTPLTMFAYSGAGGGMGRREGRPGQGAMVRTGAKALTWWRNAVLGVFVAALLGGIFLPVYSDEIGWRLQERAGFEGVDKLFVELCGPNTIAHPPFWMMPARYYSALFNSLFADPFYVRVSGILYALVWTVLVLALVRRVAEAQRDRIALSTLAIGFLSLGTMPLLLVMSRPEQPIVLAFTGAILLASAAWKPDGADTPAAAAWWRSLAILLLALVAMSYHVKGVATVPLFLVCLACSARGREALAPRLVAGAVLVAAGVWAAHYWIDRFACPDDPALRADFLRNTGAAAVSATDGSQIVPLIRNALGNVSILQFPGLPAPRTVPMSAWLPYDRISEAHSFAWFLVMIAVWVVALVATLYCLLLAGRRAWQERQVDRRAAVSAALFTTVLGWSATGFVSVYEASFAVPMMVLGVVLALSTYRGSARFAGGIRLAAAGLGLMGVISVVLVAMMYGPPLVAASHERGYLKAQRMSVGVFGYPEVRREALAAARKCGIGDPAAADRLLIDDATYFAFMRSHMPDHLVGLRNPVLSGRDPLAYLRAIKSGGVVASCRLLPAGLRAHARREGQICCVAPSNW